VVIFFLQTHACGSLAADRITYAREVSKLPNKEAHLYLPAFGSYNEELMTLNPLKKPLEIFLKQWRSLVEVVKTCITV